MRIAKETSQTTKTPIKSSSNETGDNGLPDKSFKVLPGNSCLFSWPLRNKKSTKTLFQVLFTSILRQKGFEGRKDLPFFKVDVKVELANIIRYFKAVDVCEVLSLIRNKYLSKERNILIIVGNSLAELDFLTEQNI